MIGLRRLTVGLAAIAAVLLGGALLAGSVLAQDGDGVSIADGSAATGASGEVSLSAVDISAPGLGAWTIDITYDTSVITAVDCTAEQGGVCNPEFAADTVRITGATATGLEGTTQLGVIEFECGDAAGESDLTIDLFTFADATIGDPTTIEDPNIDNGVFTCGGEPSGEPEPTDEPADEAPSGAPSAGTGFADPGNSYIWLVAFLAYLGLGGLVVGAMRKMTR